MNSFLFLLYLLIPNFIMSLPSHFNLFAFFKNKELNEFYISVSLMTFAESLISIFVPIYLYQLNYPLHSIVFYFLLVSLGFVISAGLGAQIVAKIGIKHAILFSTPILIIYYLGLFLLPNWPILFFILPILLSWRMILYNFGYHLNFFINSDKNLRGRQLSFIGILNILMTIVAPFIGGLIIFYFSFSAIYIIGSALLMIATLPLFLTRDVLEKTKFNTISLYKDIVSKKNYYPALSFSGYAIESIIGRVIWPLFLIIILLNTKNMGLIVSLSLAISIFVFYIAGQLTDKYNKIKLLRLTTLFYFLGWVGRIFANSPAKILFIDSYKNIAEKMLHITWAAYSYDLAQQTDYFKFIVQREIIFNLSRIIVMPFLIILFYLNFHPFLFSFLTAAIFSLLYSSIVNKKITYNK